MWSGHKSAFTQNNSKNCNNRINDYMKYALKIYESENIIFILFIESIYIDHSDVERNFFEKKNRILFDYLKNTMP